MTEFVCQLYVDGTERFIVTESVSGLTYYSAFIFKPGSDSMVSMTLDDRGGCKFEREKAGIFEVPKSNLEMVFTRAENPGIRFCTLFLKSNAVYHPVGSIYNIELSF